MSTKKRPSFGLRKPTAASVEKFVSGGSDAQTSGRPSARGKRSSAGEGRALVQRQDGGERRRTTIYFAPDVIKRLKVYCAERDTEMSDVVNEVVGKFLG